MSSFVLILVVVLSLFVSMFIWMPLLQSVEVLARRYPKQRSGDVPDLREDDTSPQFTDWVA